MFLGFLIVQVIFFLTSYIFFFPPINRVHLSPAATVNSPLYKAWVDNFGSGVTHIYTGTHPFFPYLCIAVFL